MEGHYGYRRILKELWPMVLMLMVTSVYSIVDGWFISNYAGSTAFASMNIIWPAVAIISAFGLMVGAGGSALVSKTFGEGDIERGNHTFTMLIRLTLVAGIAISALLFIFMRPLAAALGAEGEMVRYAVTYGRILTAALPIYMLQLAQQPFCMAAGRVSPVWYGVVVPARQAYSHSASVGRRKVRPVFADSHSQYATASAQVTSVTAWLSLNLWLCLYSLYCALVISVALILKADKVTLWAGASS